ncbi:ATPase AAA [Bacteroidia bacterium]|nr:ATPase AAA [Bacteroidia bacterium]
MIKRIHLQQLMARIKEPRKFIQVVFGPRQVGKTTLMHQLTAQSGVPHLYAAADAVSATGASWLLQLWETARMNLQNSGSTEFLLVIDEIQKIDNWSEVVKQLWDTDTFNGVNIKVILLGSSRLLLQTGLTESLAGRFETLYVGHWSFAEMEEAFGWSVEQYVYFGGYPGAASLIADEDRWRTYIQSSLIETCISKDVLMLTRVDKPALLRRLFELGALYSGQILSLTKVIGHLQDAGNTTTLSTYLKLLDDSGLLCGLAKYAGAAVRRRSSIPKFQVYNNALFTAQSQHLYNEALTNPAVWGRWVESAVGAHLVNHAIEQKYSVYYWREGANEVDFVLKHGDVVVGLEVKSGISVANKGMSAFAKLFHPNKILLVGTGGIPYPEFLKISPKELF